MEGYLIDVWYSEKLQSIGVLRSVYETRYTKYITANAIAWLYNVSEGVITFQEIRNKAHVSLGFCGYEAALEKIFCEIVTEKILNNPQATTVIIDADDLKRYENEIKALAEKYKKEQRFERIKNQIHDLHYKYTQKYRSREAWKLSYEIRDSAIEKAKKEDANEDEIIAELTRAFEELKQKDVEFLIQEKNEEIRKLKQRISELEQELQKG